jgi:hypothetical protein
VKKSVSILFVFLQTNLVGQELSYLQQTITTRSFTFSQGASSTGLAGFEVGLGSHLKKFNREEDLPNFIENKDHYFTPFLNVQKGIPYVDLMATLDLKSETGSGFGLGIQVPLLDAGSLIPSVALRGGYSSNWTADPVKWRAFNVEAATSWALPPVVKIFEPYLALGFAHYNLSEPLIIKTDWSNLYSLIGARVSLMPFLGIAVHARISSDVISYLAKISFRF